MRSATPSHCPVGLMPKGIKLLPPECLKVIMMENLSKSL